MFDIWQFLLALAALAVLGSFTVGTIWNVRKGNAVLKWLRDGLPLVGERSTMRWVGSAAVALNIAKAKVPFRSADTVIYLEPRDVFFLWAYYRARGRRDLLIFRAQLHDAPTFDLEALDPRAWSAQGAARVAQSRGWTRLALNTQKPLTVYYSGVLDPNVAQILIHLAESVPGKMVRLSVHRSAPNFEIHWQLPDLTSHSARDWFGKLRRMGETIAQTP